MEQHWPALTYMEIYFRAVHIKVTYADINLSIFCTFLLAVTIRNCAFTAKPWWSCWRFQAPQKRDPCMKIWYTDEISNTLLNDSKNKIYDTYGQELRYSFRQLNSTKQQWLTTIRNFERHNKVFIPPISQTIQSRRTRHTGHCWWSKDELISEPSLIDMNAPVLAEQQKTCIHQLNADTRCRLENLLRAMADIDGWRERERERGGGERESEFIVLVCFDDDDDDNRIC